jgi:hypothetical protein
MAHSQIFEYETSLGEPVAYAGGRLTLFSRNLVLRSPRGRGVLVWNRPAAVLVKKDDGSEQVIPIVDVTRRWQVALFAGALAGVILFGLGMRKRLMS